MSPMPPRSPAPVLPIAAPPGTLPATLGEVLDTVWSRLADGARERWIPWGLPVLATVGPDGAPQARVLALRGVDRASRSLAFHTDVRSAKAAALGHEPRATLAFWDPYDAVEVRLDGRVTLHRGDDVAAAAWRDASPLSKSAAGTALAPGTRLSVATAFEQLVQEGDERVAFGHFAALAFEIDAIDWLWLGPRDLRRARFRFTGRDWSSEWVVP